jgi:hypothetical protein
MLRVNHTTSIAASRQIARAVSLLNRADRIIRSRYHLTFDPEREGR